MTNLMTSAKITSVYCITSYNFVTWFLCEYSQPNANTRIYTKVEMMKTVLHGWFVYTLTESVIHKSLQEVWLCQHSKPNSTNNNTRIDTNMEMLKNVLYGWFVNTLTERVI